MIEDDKVVRDLLRHAFADVPRPEQNLGTLSVCHGTCIQLRSDLVSMWPEEQKWWLPRILEDLIDTHTGHPIVTQEIESVISFVNVEERDTFDEDAKLWDTETAEYIRQQRLESLSDRREFSKLCSLEEGKAILEWLKLARNWRDTELYRDDIDDAIAFWKTASGE